MNEKNFSLRARFEGGITGGDDIYMVDKRGLTNAIIEQMKRV